LCANVRELSDVVTKICQMFDRFPLGSVSRIAVCTNVCKWTAGLDPRSVLTGLLSFPRKLCNTFAGSLLYTSLLRYCGRYFVTTNGVGGSGLIWSFLWLQSLRPPTVEDVLLLLDAGGFHWSLMSDAEVGVYSGTETVITTLVAPTLCGMSTDDRFQSCQESLLNDITAAFQSLQRGTTSFAASLDVRKALFDAVPLLSQHPSASSKASDSKDGVQSLLIAYFCGQLQCSDPVITRLSGAPLPTLTTLLLSHLQHLSSSQSMPSVLLKLSQLLSRVLPTQPAVVHALFRLCYSSSHTAPRVSKAVMQLCTTLVRHDDVIKWLSAEETAAWQACSVLDPK
jgi:hypothetical protein